MRFKVKLAWISIIILVAVLGTTSTLSAFPAATTPSVPGATECAEPNDDYQHACNMPPAMIALTGVISPSGDKDWYRISFDAPQTATVRLYGMPGDADYDLFIYGDPPASPIAASVSPGNQDEVLTLTLPSGVSYILVDGFSGSGSYTLMWTGNLKYRAYLPAVLR